MTDRPYWSPRDQDVVHRIHEGKSEDISIG